MARVRVYEAGNSVAVHLALAALLDAGVDARAEANHLLGAWGDDSLPVAVWVEARDAALARQVLAAFEPGGSAAEPKGSPWTCATCGESNGPAFRACWQCQAEP